MFIHNSEHKTRMRQIYGRVRRNFGSVTYVLEQSFSDNGVYPQHQPYTARRWLLMFLANT